MSEKFIATGGFTQATTAIAVNIEIGFKPKCFRIFNETLGVYEEWNDQMADAEGILNPGSVASTVSKLITSNGITPILTESTSSPHTAPSTIEGVTFGLDTTVNTASDVYTWVAFR